MEQQRVGQPIPEGMNIITVGLKQLVYAMQEILKLRQTFIYLVGNFLLSDSVSTSVRVFTL